MGCHRKVRFSFGESFSDLSYFLLPTSITSQKIWKGEKKLWLPWEFPKTGYVIENISSEKKEKKRRKKKIFKSNDGAKCENSRIVIKISISKSLVAPFQLLHVSHPFKTSWKSNNKGRNAKLTEKRRKKNSNQSFVYFDSSFLFVFFFIQMDEFFFTA